MVSTKFYCGYDEYIYVSEWAEYGNMAVDELKELELDFLDAMVHFDNAILIVPTLRLMGLFLFQCRTGIFSFRIMISSKN